MPLVILDFSLKNCYNISCYFDSIKISIFLTAKISIDDMKFMI